MAQGRLLTLLPPPPPESRSTGRDRSEESDVEGMLDDPFDIVPQKKKKEASSVDRLRRWRQAALMLNTSRHDICNLDLKKEEEKMREICRRASTSDTGNLSSFQRVIRAAFRIKEVKEKDLRVTRGAFPPDVPVPALMLEPGAGLLGLFVSAPEVAICMLRDQGRPSPFEPNFGRRGRKAGRDGGLPMGRPEPRKIRRGRAYRRWGF